MDVSVLSGAQKHWKIKRWLVCRSCPLKIIKTRMMFGFSGSPKYTKGAPWAGFCSARLSIQKDPNIALCLFFSGCSKIFTVDTMSGFSSLCSKSVYSAKSTSIFWMSGFSGSSK
jgi:hypothetical protein